MAANTEKAFSALIGYASFPSIFMTQFSSGDEAMVLRPKLK